MRSKLYTSIILFTLVFASCTLNFVKDDVIKQLQSRYEGIYVALKDIESGNDEKIKAGTKMRLYFLSGSNSLKVYSYPVDMVREKALGQNILYLFDTEFPDSKFIDELLDKRLSEIVKKIN